MQDLSVASRKQQLRVICGQVSKSAKATSALSNTCPLKMGRACSCIPEADNEEHKGKL
jgi:hypothetical protein